MPQDQDLQLLRPLRTTKENQQLEQTANDPVSERQTLKEQTSSTHLRTLPARTTPVTPLRPSAHGRRSRGTSLWDPQAEVAEVHSSPRFTVRARMFADPDSRPVRSDAENSSFAGKIGSAEVLSWC
jgi:hypothetical protein